MGALFKLGSALEQKSANPPHLEALGDHRVLLVLGREEEARRAARIEERRPMLDEDVDWKGR